MKHSLEEVRAEYNRLDKLCRIDTSHIQLSVSTRATRRLGCFSFKAGKPLQIILSANVLEDESSFLETIRHEYAHAITYLRYPKERHNHDAVWKAACIEVGCKPRATMTPNSDTSPRRKLFAKYTIRCNSCGIETHYQRAGKIVKLMNSPHRKSLYCSRCNSHDLTFIVL